MTEIGLVTYISGILKLEIVDKLYILQETNNSETYLVSATRLDDASDFIGNTKILNREFKYSKENFKKILKKLKKEKLLVTTTFAAQNYKSCPYRLKMWVIRKN